MEDKASLRLAEKGKWEIFFRNVENKTGEQVVAQLEIGAILK